MRKIIGICLVILFLIGCSQKLRQSSFEKTLKLAIASKPQLEFIIRIKNYKEYKKYMQNIQKQMIDKLVESMPSLRDDKEDKEKIHNFEEFKAKKIVDFMLNQDYYYQTLDIALKTKFQVEKYTKKYGNIPYYVWRYKDDIIEIIMQVNWIEKDVYCVTFQTIEPYPIGKDACGFNVNLANETIEEIKVNKEDIE